MNVSAVVPSELHLEGLTESERDAIFEVLRRDMELQSKGSEKLRILRAEVNALQSLSNQTEAAGNQDKVCPLCHVEFGWLFNRGDLCPLCQTKVCDKCQQTGTSRHKWLCTLCSKQIELKTRSGSWFYGKFRRSRRKKRDNEIPTRREDTPHPFTRKKAPSTGALHCNIIVDEIDSFTDSKMEAKTDIAVIKEQPFTLSETHSSLENVIFPKESDKRLLAELLSSKNRSLSLTEDNICSEETLSFACKPARLNGQIKKSGDDRIEISNEMMESSGLIDVQQRNRNLRSSSDILGQSRDSWDKEADSTTTTDEEIASNFQQKSKAVNGQLLTVSEHLDKMPVAQSDGVRSPSSPRETQSIWFSASPKSTAAAVQTLTSDGRDRSLADGRIKRETAAASTFDTIPEHFRHASVTKRTRNPDENVTQNEMQNNNGANDEVDNQDLLKFTYKKTHPLHETDRKLRLNTRSVPGSAANRFAVYYEDDDDDDSLSVMSKKTGKEANHDLSTIIVNSSELLNSDPEDEEWCRRNKRRIARVKDECVVSVTDQKELDSFISRLASEEIMLTKGSKVDPSFDAITESNRKVLQFSSSQENVKLKTEKKIAERSVENKGLIEQKKIVPNYVMPNLELVDNKQADTSSLKSSPRAVSFTNKADAQKHPLSHAKKSILLNKPNALASKSQPLTEDVLVTGATCSTSYERMSKKQESLDSLRKPESEYFMDAKSLGTKQKHKSSVSSDSLSHLVSEEFALTGTSNDLEAEISASAAYNEVFLSDLDESLSLSEICRKQSWNDQNVVDMQHSKSAMRANLHEKIDLRSVKKQLGIGTIVSSETPSISPKYHNNVQKKIVLQEVLKTNENRNENGSKVGGFKLCSKEGFCPLIESMGLTTDFGHGKSIPLESNILRSKETDSEAESWRVVERSASDQQQLFLQPVLRTTETDDTDDDDDLQLSGSVLLNHKGTIFAVQKVPERVGPQLNIAVESTIDFETVSADDAGSEMATAKSCNVAGAFHSATPDSVQLFLAPFDVPLTADINSQLDAKLDFPGELHLSQDNVLPVLVVTQHIGDADRECAEILSVDRASGNSAELQDNSSCKQSFSTINAISQESILSSYSNPGKSHLGKIAATGEIELSIRYNDRSSTIDVFVRQCKGLAPADAKKKRSDPYVKTYLLPNKSKSGKRKTATKKGTLNPVYNEVLRYEVEEEELEQRTLWVSVWHNDRLGHNEFLGDVLIQLDSKVLSEIEPQWYSLEQEAGVKWKSVLNLTSKADLDLSLKYITADRTIGKIKGKQKKPYGELLATVKMAHNLSAVHGNNLSNPFCKCRLLPEQLHQSKQKTRIVKHSCNPTWNHTFVFTSIALEDLPDSGLELTIWDHDRLKSHDFLGGVRLNLGSPAVRQSGKEWMDAAGDEISLWRNMMTHPNEWVEATVPLRSYMGD